MVGLGGLEPPTSPLSGARSSHLSYRPQHRRGNVHNYLIVRWFSVFRNCVYSSSRLVTLCLSPISFPTGDEFQWGEVGERLVRAHAVVGVFPMAQLMIELQWLIRVRVHLIELFMVGAVRALDMGIEFR